MTSSGPTKQEIESVFGRLRSQAANKSCFDCGAKAPTWSSVTYGIFICIDCSAVHRNLGVHLTFVRSTNLDTNWTWLQLRQMQLGGNANASQFFRQHNCNTTDAQQKYNSRAAQLYRDKLQKLAQNAMKQHGTKLHLENQSDKPENEVTKIEEEDFFTLCDESSFETTSLNQKNNNSNDQMAKIDITPKPSALSSNLGGEPSVDLLNSVLTNNGPAPTIGARKIQPKKTGIGARKGGLGATKVKTNFAEIEQRANLANQFKEPVPEKKLTVEEELESCASVRLAYQDLSIKQSKEEAKMKTTDPLKAKQMERLGMGFNLRGSDVSHSALSDMETISQTAAPKSSSSSSGNKSSYDREINSDSFDSLLGYPPSMYKTSKQDKELEMMGFESIEPIDSHHSNITSMFASQSANNSTTSTATSKPVLSEKSAAAPTRKAFGKASAVSVDSNDDKAQKKFGSAKGISSDQFFGNEQSSSEISSNLSRFQGSNSISSSDYFNDGSSSSTTSNRSSRRGYTTAANFNAPDMDDVKESVRQGVTKVAGRLSNLANDVMSSLQDKYGY
ncbi:ADP-ribosylation factor GTPase-activating protein 2 [Episyrphus balteatus]|uniref:ADP-ribosylation factor GTPase-activating protein 2 n=1 Tax=Episyrphus balteatus TaxID=286459 RepID=UPI00248655EC|nr:ADP-ribosylation factor GTPase-activating protein 2 [Episyrphus balteatus]